MKIYIWFRRLLIIIVFLVVLWILKGPISKNITIVKDLKNTFSGFSLKTQEEANDKCTLAQQYYDQGKYQQVIDTLLATYLESPDIILRGSQCGPASIDLATSLKFLDRPIEENQVYHRIIDLNPSNRGWVMHFATLELCQAAVEAGNWLDAMNYWTIAYDSALNVPPETRIVYEERAWKYLAKMVTTMNGVLGNQKAFEVIQETQEKYPGSASWFILAGYASEVRCDIVGATQVYQQALDLAPQSIFLKQHLALLRNEQSTCTP